MSVYTVGRYFTVETPQGLHNARQIKYLHPNIVCMPKRSALAPTTQADFVDRFIFSLGHCVCVPSARLSRPSGSPSALFHKLTCHLPQEVFPDTPRYLPMASFCWYKLGYPPVLWSGLTPFFLHKCKEASCCYIVGGA